MEPTTLTRIWCDISKRAKNWTGLVLRDELRRNPERNAFGLTVHRTHDFELTFAASLQQVGTGGRQRCAIQRS